MTELVAAQEELITAEEAANTSNGGAPITVEAAPALWAAVRLAQDNVLIIQRKINKIDTDLAQCDLDTDVAIQEAVRETGAYAQFIACPFTPNNRRTQYSSDRDVMDLIIIAIV